MFSSRKKDEDKDKDGSRGSVAKKRAEREAINQKLTRLMVPPAPCVVLISISFSRTRRPPADCAPPPRIGPVAVHLLNGWRGVALFDNN
jgi:hypothetical protein